MPTKPGKYEVCCMESDYKWTPVEIYRQNGQLKINCPDLGKGYLLQHYHDGLTDIQWRLVGW